MKIPFRHLLAGALLIGTSWTAIPAHSQPQNPGQPTAEIREGKVYEIPVKNVAPHLLAWWIDSAHQPTPPELGEAQQNVPRQRGGVFALPDGIERIVPVDAKKILIVTGTAEGVAKLATVVAFLDKPLRQVEVEIHVVPLNSQQLTTLGLDPAQPPAGATTPDGESAQPRFSLSRPNNNLSNLLETRPQRGPLAEAKVPRVLALNNFMASVAALRTYPVPADVQDKLATLVPQSPIDAPLELQTPLQINFTPTINNDDTVSVLMDLKGQVQLGRTGQTNGLALGNPSALTCIANVKDGETIALRGFDRNFTSAFLGAPTPTKVPLLGDIPLINNEGAKVPMLGDIPMIGKLFPNRKRSPLELVVFLTPRIVHRAQQ